ncbi:MAG TPA: PSD1 and planctomycete cytochrome C domain-containing protein [Gemmataceae bacterium]|nr:PSD1 and planctomycete cytochrome C domain-containing protein [Gemmataceae bacterium]
MNARFIRVHRWQLAILYLGSAILSVRAEEPAPGKKSIDFDRQIRPLLSENCFACHGPDDKQRKADLRLDQRAGAVGVDKVIVPGKSATSELWVRISEHDPSRQMPPRKSGKKLSAEQIALFRRWIDEGAAWTTHWSFQKPERPKLPAVRNVEWARNPIDRFILARLEKESLTPRAEADRETLVRRLTFDLTGLPPTPAEIDAFLADNRPGAYERLVDRLLDSPRYGERMGLDWLDAARYADTHGYHLDSGRDMTRWREWVIDSLNHNLPFDRFTIEQLAGDLLPNATVEQKIASGFNRNNMINFEGGAVPEEYQTAYVIDRVNTTSTVWLGLTVGCAQCHDHKYDPIAQKEFYRLYALFNKVPENGLDGSTGNAEPMVRFPTPEEEKNRRALADALTALGAHRAALAARAATAQSAWEEAAAASVAVQDAYKLPSGIRPILSTAADKRTPMQKTELTQYYTTTWVPELKAVDVQLRIARQKQASLQKVMPTAMVMADMIKPRDTFVLMRGQYDQKGEKVTAGVPAFLPPLISTKEPNRLDFARWLVEPNHPLTSRVIVNRAWQLYFGAGLVKTVEDFGSQGEWPSHPELLDWLATEFVRSGWNVKALHRQIVTSATYRQSSVVRPELVARDPENRLLARGPRFRLQAEFIRDQALAVSGLLNGEIGGHSVSPYQPPGLWEELSAREDSKNWTAQSFVQGHGQDLYRRTMYTFWKRTSPPPSLTTFDAPDRETCTVRRPRTNTPLQALVLLNDPTYVEASRKFAERLLGEATTNTERVRLAFRLTTGRLPKPAETKVLMKMQTQALAVFQSDRARAEKLLNVGESPRNQSFDSAELASWTVVAQALLNLDEVVSRN